MTKLLITDDEAGIRSMIRDYAEFLDYEVREADCGKAAIDMVKNETIDIVLMDIMMPQIDGFTAVKEIKKINPNIPVIMLSARGEEYDKLFGFELGVDDYIVKPFSLREVMARVAAVLKRASTPRDTVKDYFVYKGLEIDQKGRNVIVDGKRAEMTPKEYDLLFYLLNNKEVAVSREQLLSNVWGYDFFGDDRTVDTHVKMLRGSLGAYRDLIVTLRCVGYKFSTDEQQ